METNLEKAKRLVYDHAYTGGIELPKDGFLFKMLELAATPEPKWVNVNDLYPEQNAELIRPQDHELFPEMTVKLIVLTNRGTITDNCRLKMKTGKWAWLMGYDDDEENVTHWQIFTEPDDAEPHVQLK